MKEAYSCKNSVLDLSVDDGTSKQLESYFQERQHGRATKPLDWTKLGERGAAEVAAKKLAAEVAEKELAAINKQWHTQYPACCPSCAASYYEYHPSELAALQATDGIVKAPE